MAVSVYLLALFLNAITAAVLPTQQGQARQVIAEPSASIDAGLVIGIQTSVDGSSNLVNKYLGIPFAASPTRFAPAETATPWTQPYRATQNGPACIQVRPYPCKTLFRPSTEQEIAIQLPRGVT
jgi:hypothetical protein